MSSPPADAPGRMPGLGQGAAMRIFLAVVLAWISAAPASAQAIDSGFVFGRDYTFERLEATRTVDDAQDKGTIRLVTYVYRPVKNDRHEVAVFSHGSTGGLSRSPRSRAGGMP